MTVTVPGPARTKSGTRKAIEEPRPDTALAPSPHERRSGRPRSAAAQRAYERRAQREGRPAERIEEDLPATSGRARFVVLIMVLLVVGIAATLWLTTQAIADSYRLEQIKQQSTDLSERADLLQREVTKLDSPSALAERARELGMVFPGDPARLVVQPDGSIAVVGEPRPATAPAPPPPPPAPAQQPAAGQQQGPGQQPAAGQPESPAQQQAPDQQPGGQQPGVG